MHVPKHPARPRLPGARLVNNQLHITSEAARTYDSIMTAVRRRYYSENPVLLTVIVFEDADYARLSCEPVPHTEHSLLSAVCCAVFQQFNIRSVYARSTYARHYTAALAHINRARIAVQRPLDPTTAGWTDNDVFVEARRLDWRDA